MNEKQEYMEIDIISMLMAIVKRWWVVLIAIIVGAVLVGGYAKLFVPPKYEATTLLYVNSSSVSIGSTSLSISSGDITAAKTLVNTYSVILNTRLTLEDVIDRADLDYSYEKLQTMIKAGSKDNTEVLYVTATSTDPEEACLIANTIAEVLPEKITKVLNGSSVSIVDLAVVPSHRSAPSYARYVVVGALIGAVIACGIIVLIQYFNDDITSPDWVVDTFREECPLLAVVPNYDRKVKRYGHSGKGVYNSDEYGR